MFLEERLNAFVASGGDPRRVWVDPGVGFGKTLEPGRRPALLIIDFVRAYLVKDSPLYAGVEAAHASARALLAAARAARIPVLHTNVVFQPGGRDGGVFFRKVPALRCFEAGAHPELAAFAEGLEPIAGETVVSKQYASAFFGTSVASFFAKEQVDTVFVTGCTTSGCVRASVIDAFSYGFRVMVPEPCSGDQEEAAHKANLLDVARRYADVLTMEESLAYFAGVAQARATANA